MPASHMPWLTGWHINSVTAVAGSQNRASSGDAPLRNWVQTHAGGRGGGGGEEGGIGGGGSGRGEDGGVSGGASGGGHVGGGNWGLGTIGGLRASWLLLFAAQGRQRQSGAGGGCLGVQQLSHKHALGS